MNPKTNKALVIAEHKDGKITPATLEALDCACQLTGSMDQVTAVVLARDAEAIAKELALTGLAVTGFSGELLEHYIGETYGQILQGFVKENPCTWIVLPHTSLGMDLGPALAARLEAAFVPGVQEVKPEENIFIRPIYNGKFSQEIRPSAEVIVCGILPGSFAGVEEASSPGVVNLVEYTGGPGRTSYLGVSDSDGQDFSLAQADIIVCAGRGMGSEENIEVVKQLAELFPRAAVAGSRIACDLGWLPYNHQIGVTGQTVAPKLYIGCGVSGAFQHVVGMSGSQLVVAVNTDSKAPIFNVADYCIVEDAIEFLPALVEAAGGDS